MVLLLKGKDRIQKIFLQKNLQCANLRLEIIEIYYKGCELSKRRSTAEKMVVDDVHLIFSEEFLGKQPVKLHLHYLPVKAYRLPTYKSRHSDRIVNGVPLLIFKALSIENED